MSHLPNRRTVTPARLHRCPTPLKRGYTSRKRALMRGHQASPNVALRAYRCRGCHLWHLTSQVET